MAIEKPKKKKRGFSFDEMDNFQPLETAPVQQTETEEVTAPDTPTGENAPKKRGRKPGCKLNKSYKFQLIPGAVETQLLITIPVELHEKIKEWASLKKATVKEFVAKGLADIVSFDYQEELVIETESQAVSLVAADPGVWNKLPECYRTPLVFQTIINTNPSFLLYLNHVTEELLATITADQWVRIVAADYNAIKIVPAVHKDAVMRVIEERINSNG